MVAFVWHVAQLKIQRDSNLCTAMEQPHWGSDPSTRPREAAVTQHHQFRPCWRQTDPLQFMSLAAGCPLRQERSLKCFSFLQKPDLANSDKYNYQTTASSSVLTCWTLPNPDRRRGPHSATIQPSCCPEHNHSIPTMGHQKALLKFSSCSTAALLLI